MGPNSPIDDYRRVREGHAESLVATATELFEGLEGVEAVELAVRTGCEPIEGGLRIRVWDRDVIVRIPGFAVGYEEGDESLDPFTLALVAHYLATADGTPETGSCVAFGELPDGAFYTRAFQGYTGNQLARVFGNDVEAFARAAAAAGGMPEPLADRSFSFRVLPMVRVTVACWMGDEDFPSSYSVLFDSNAPHHLPSDVFAVVGSTLCRKLIAAHDSA